MNGTSPESQTNGRPAGPGFGDGKLKRADELENVSYARRKKRNPLDQQPLLNCTVGPSYRRYKHN